MSSLTQFTGFRDIPLTPTYSEPAFCVSGYGQQPIWMYNQSNQMTNYYDWAGGEMVTTGSYFNSNWSSSVSTNSTWTVAGTTLASMHGHLFTSATPTVDCGSIAAGGAYLNGNNQNSGTYYGSLNSVSTGVWVNKTKRDNLCIQRVNNGTNYGSYLYSTQISTYGYGAYFCPITSTRSMTGSSAEGIANGYNTTRSYGTVGYNETTKMWVIGANAAGGSGDTFYVYKNINPPTVANCNNGSFWSQFNHGTKITVTFNFPSVNETLDYQHFKLIPLDNGNIAMIYKNAQTSINYRLFVGNAGVDSTSWTMNPSDTATVSTTTSYHNSSFAQHDFLPVIVSNDGQYLCVFTQYYYYQAGICGFFIRVSDGSARIIYFSDSSYAYNPIAMQKNEFYVGYGVNADGGAGMQFFRYDPEYLFATTAANTDVSGLYSYIGVDLPYTSTQYPMVWTQPSYLPNFIRGVF
jgi:hypothetical protein